MNGEFELLFNDYIKKLYADESIIDIIISKDLLGIDGDLESLKNLIKRDGVLMTNIKNGKTYCVYEITSIANVIGKRFCIIQLMKDGELYGPISVKPLSLFKEKNY